MAASKWRSIADDLADKIERGEISRGQQLPTELELQIDYDASRNTVRDAIKWLIQRQLVVKHPGGRTRPPRPPRARPAGGRRRPASRRPGTARAAGTPSSRARRCPRS